MDTIRHSLRSAFSLVELLVVLAVISVLAAMLLPTLEQCLEKTRTIACAGNLRQQSTAVSAYADDSKGFLPPRILANPANPAVGKYFAIHLGECYMSGTWSAWKCPSDAVPPVYYIRYSYAQISGNNSTSLNNWNGVSPMFQTNIDMTVWNYSLNYYSSFRIPQVDSAAMYAGELHMNTMVINVNPISGGYGQGAYGRDQAALMTYPHDGWAGNILFVDGHVEALEKSAADLDKRGNRWPGR